LCFAKKLDNMNRSTMKELVERLVESWNAHDPDAVAQCYAPDAVSRDITLSGSEPLRGRDAIRNAAAMYMGAFPDIRFDIRRVACDRDLICEEWRATGTHEGDLMGLEPTGRKGSTLGCNVIQVGADGLIHSETTYWDAAGLYRQLGALRELARVAE
jgi:steroid delta-isomerase-like uncharacterized protein